MDTNLSQLSKSAGETAAAKPCGDISLAEPTGIIPNQWYGILEARTLRRKPLAIMRMGEKLLLYRDSAGKPVCILNQCPHRGMELTHGRVFGDLIECPFHGFRFNPMGACTFMPCEGRDARPPRAMRTITFPVREQYGILWLWWGADADALGMTELPAIPWHDSLPDTPYTSTGSFVWPMPHHRVIENSIDAHHAPALHGQRRGWRGWKVPGLGRRTRNDPFEVQTVPGGMNSIYNFRDEAAPEDKAFRTIVDYREPGLVYAVINSRLHLLTIDTPIDAKNTWRIIRYFNVSVRIPLIGSLIAYAMRIFDQLAIQWNEDFWVIKNQQDGIEAVIEHHYVKSDTLVALYYRLQRDLLKKAEATRAHLPPVVLRHFTPRHRHTPSVSAQADSV